MLNAELAATNGYANVMVKGHAKQRQRDWQRLARTDAPAQQTGRPNIAGWNRLAALTERSGGSVQRGGHRLVTH